MSNDSPNQVPEEWLSAYLDNELDEDQRIQVEFTLSQDPKYAQLLEELRATRQLIRHLPSFPSVAASIDATVPQWRTEIDDGLVDDMGSDDLDTDDLVDTGNEDSESLASTSPRQLERSLASDEHSFSSNSISSPGQNRSGSWAMLRWIALAASLAGIAFLGSLLLPKDNDRQLGSTITTDKNAESQPPDAQTGSMGIAGGASEPRSPSLGTGDITADAGLSELSQAKETPNPVVDPAPANFAPDNFAPLDPAPKARAEQSLRRVESAADFADSSTPNQTDIAATPDRMFAEDALPQNANSPLSPLSPLEIAPPSPVKPLADAAQPPPSAIGSGVPRDSGIPSRSKVEASQLKVDSARQRMQLSAPDKEKGSVERLPFPEKIADKKQAAPIEDRVTFHRSGSWSDESFSSQWEVNNLLRQLRSPMQKVGKSDQEFGDTNQRTSEQVAAAVPMAFLRVTEQNRRVLNESLKSLNISPAIPELKLGVSLVLFVNEEELNQISKAVSPNERFWIDSEADKSASPLRILVIRER
jgi:hypothetical protein